MRICREEGLKAIITYIINAIPNLGLQPVQLMRQGAQTHGIQHQPAMTAGGTGGARARIAGSPRAPSSGGAVGAGMAILEGDLLLLAEDLDLGRGKAQRSVGDRG